MGGDHPWQEPAARAHRLREDWRACALKLIHRKRITKAADIEKVLIMPPFPRHLPERTTQDLAGDGSKCRSRAAVNRWGVPRDPSEISISQASHLNV